MSGFTYVCPTCSRTFGDVDGRLQGTWCAQCGGGPLKLSEEWLTGSQAKVATPAESKKNSSAATPATYDAPYDERCFYCRNKFHHSDYFHNGSIEFRGEGTPPDIEAKVEGDLEGSDAAQFPYLRERPIDLFVTAMRVTRKMLRALKRNYSDVKTVRIPCVDCGLACLVAESSQDAIDHAQCVGQRAEVICFQCCKKAGISVDAAGLTEAQARELSQILMRRSVTKENAN